MLVTRHLDWSRSQSGDLVTAAAAPADISGEAPPA
jgi:hypothetical protein